MENSKKDYLALIQETIGRMSTAAAVFKGFSATIVTGVFALSYTNMKIAIMIISFFPVIAFAALDIYYLKIEKKYRGLYNDVLYERRALDFSLDIPKDKAFIIRAKATVWDCIKSPSIFLFYPVMLIILVVMCFLK